MNRLSQLLLLAIFSTRLLAQGAGGEMTRERMQNLAQNAEKIQECINKLDPAITQRVQEAGEKIANEIDALCAAGKRDEAQAKALAYAKSMANSRDAEQMRACGIAADEILPDLQEAQTSDSDLAPPDVCDTD